MLLCLFEILFRPECGPYDMQDVTVSPQQEGATLLLLQAFSRRPHRIEVSASPNTILAPNIPTAKEVCPAQDHLPFS